MAVASGGERTGDPVGIGRCRWGAAKTALRQAAASRNGEAAKTATMQAMASLSGVAARRPGLAAVSMEAAKTARVGSSQHGGRQDGPR